MKSLFQTSMVLFHLFAQIMQYLEHSSDVIATSALAFLSMLLHFGNKNAQKAFASICQLKPDLFIHAHKVFTTVSSILLTER